MADFQAMMPKPCPLVYIVSSMVPAESTRGMKMRPKECALAVAFDHCPTAEEIIDQFEVWYPELRTDNARAHLEALYKGYEPEPLLELLAVEDKAGRCSCLSQTTTLGVTITVARGPLA